jgi:flagellar basal-body rod protein FlgC
MGAMSSAMTIAASGMQAASVWISSAASNLANIQTNGPVPATPPDQPVSQARGNVYQATTVQQTARTDGGVSTSLAAVLPSYLVAYDPTSPMANSQGLIATPNVDPATEFVSILEARSAFSASMAAFKAADGITRSLLNLVA